jgi:6-phosphofructokinase 1
MGTAVKGKAVIGQSGGPTPVINQSLAGVIEEARKNSPIASLWGALHGIKGMLEGDYVDLLGESPDRLRRVAETPGAALGSVRFKPKKKHVEQLFESFRKRDIRYFFYIGGNDSAETAHIVNQVAKDADYELRIFHIPKTVDNDLLENDHCPGYGSAARYVASAVMGNDLDCRALPGVKIDIIMGRHAGFLTAASVLGRTRPDDGPHLVYVPEKVFDTEQFKKDVAAVVSKLGRCFVAASEGVEDAEGNPIGAQEGVKDSHGNVQLSGSGALGDYLADLARDELGEKTRVRSDTYGYAQRSFPGFASPVDATEAREAGRWAVRYAMAGDIDGSVSIRRVSDSPYEVDYPLVELANVAAGTKKLPEDYIDPDGNNVLETYKDYALPFVGELPTAERLAMKRAE